MRDDPVLPPSLAGRIAALEDRIRILETANRLASSSVQGGSLKVLNDAGGTVARVGRLASGADGFALDDPAGPVGMMSVSATYGWALPYMVASTWVRPAEAETVTSGTFVDCWLARAEQNLSLHLRFNLYIATDAATTAEVKVLYGGVQIGDTLVVAGSHGAYREFAAPSGGQLFAGPYYSAIQARRTGGTGNVYIYRPFGAVMGRFDQVMAVTGWIP